MTTCDVLHQNEFIVCPIYVGVLLKTYTGYVINHLSIKRQKHKFSKTEKIINYFHILNAYMLWRVQTDVNLDFRSEMVPIGSRKYYVVRGINKFSNPQCIII